MKIAGCSFVGKCPAVQRPADLYLKTSRSGILMKIVSLFALSILYIPIQCPDPSPPDQVHGNPYNYKEYKKEKRLTQQTLADQIDVTSSVISKWENGKGFPDI